MRKIINVLLSASALTMVAAPLASAQEPQDAAASSDGESDEEIVVTGTSIRGVAPAGANVIGLNTADVAATGTTDTTSLLATVPQLGQFGGLPQVVGVGPQQASNRPNLRNLDTGTSGGSATLILMDGHRIPGVGVIQTVPDPDIVPPGVIQRVEVVTDGGSSVYGADAVGGVINFITRSDFDGVELNWREGFGDEYRSTDGYLTLGEDWGRGSAYVSYNYSQHDAIFGEDRDYVRRIAYADGPGAIAGLPVTRSCDTSNVNIGGSNGVGGADFNVNVGAGGALTFPAGTPASVRCDSQADNAIYPQERRDSVFAGFSQDLTDTLTFEARAWYTNRVTKAGGGTTPASDIFADITPANNNFYQQIPGTAPGATQRVYYNYAGFNPDTVARIDLETWGVSPSLAWDIGADWQARGFLNYGRSTTATSDGGIDATAAAANFANINFYNLAATDPTIIRAVLDGNEQSGEGEGELLNSRIVFDGPLIRLPAGNVSLAVGAEYLEESYDGFNSQQTPARFSDERDSTSFFGELNIPIVGPDNNVPLVYSLDINLSARRDNYSDFGETTNPRVGITYEPVDWITVRGNWGESFQAPSLADTANTGATIAQFPAAALAFALPAGFVVTPGDRIFAIFGAAPLEAQTSESYSIGLEVRPPILEGLQLNLSYYEIDFTGLITSPPTFLPSFWLDPAVVDFRQIDDTGFTNGEITSILNAMASGSLSPTQINQALAVPGGDVTIVVDNRRRNLGQTLVSGYDFGVRYVRDLNFGSIYFNVQGSYRENEQSDLTGLGLGPNQAGHLILTSGPRWGATATLGADIGENFRAQATLIHRAGEDITPTVANGQQSEIDPNDIINLFFQYDFDGSGVREDLSVSLGINNVFNEDPSHFNGSTFLTHGYVGGNLGRVVQVGLNKRF